MLLAFGIGFLVLVSVVLHFHVVAQWRLIFGPESIFLLLGSSTFCATWYACWKGDADFHPYGTFVGLGVVAFVAGTLASKRLVSFEHRDLLWEYSLRPWEGRLAGSDTYWMGVVAVGSTLVTGVYFYFAGALVPFKVLARVFVDDLATLNESFRQLRASTSGAVSARYLWPGYVAQFKNCLLPLTCLLFYFKFAVSRRIVWLTAWCALLVATALATTGTGSRFPFAIFVATFLFVGTSPLVAPFRMSDRLLLGVGVVGATLLIGLTIMMGARGQQATRGFGPLWAPAQIVDRALFFPGREKVVVYQKFLATEPPQWGRGALRQLATVLPGRPSTEALSNRLHALVYGNPKGNVALDYWGALWFDFRWLGLLASALTGLLLNLYYVSLLKGTKNLLRVATMSFAGVALGTSPDLHVLFLRGFLTCFVFLYLAHLLRVWTRRRHLHHCGAGGASASPLG